VKIFTVDSPTKPKIFTVDSPTKPKCQQDPRNATITNNNDFWVVTLIGAITISEHNLM